jgi:hypothetical protein
VVSSAKGKTCLKTDLKGFTSLGDIKSGLTFLQDIPKKVKNEGRDPEILGDLAEAVMFRDLTKQETRAVTKERQIKKGRFGRTQT